MKNLKLSKIGWLLLAAGAFIVVLAGLGITRYGQGGDEDRLNAELAFSAKRLNNMDLKPLQTQLAGLQADLTDSQARLEAAKANLVQSVISVDVVDIFYEIAHRSGIFVENIGTTKEQPAAYEGVPCILDTVNARVGGTLTGVVDFVAALNAGYQTGFVQSVRITISDGATADITLLVYTYEGD